MSISRYQIYFCFLSVFLLGSLYYIIYFHYNGFASSLTFDGGVRISLRMPVGEGKKEIEAAVKMNNFQGVLIRQSDVRSNIWDIEFGPKIRDMLAKKVIQPKLQKNITKIKSKKKDAKDIKSAKNKTRKISDEVNLNVSDEVERKLLISLKLSPNNIVSSEAISASYGKNLLQVALQILLYTLIAITLYLSFRFDFPFAVGACVALIHDLLFTLAFIGIFRIEPSIPVLAGVLTILGYSINDTIVIFDRIRENTEDRVQATTSGVVDLSIAQTLSRTVVTSVLTLVAVFALLLGGEKSLKDFSIVLLFGIGIGTYSSIFIATPVVHYYERFRSWRK